MTNGRKRRHTPIKRAESAPVFEEDYLTNKRFEEDLLANKSWHSAATNKAITVLNAKGRLKFGWPVKK